MIRRLRPRRARLRTGTVAAIVEARDATPAQLAMREINTGIYPRSAALLRAALAELRPDNAQREYYLTDIVTIARGARLAASSHGARPMRLNLPASIRGRISP